MRGGCVALGLIGALSWVLGAAGQTIFVDVANTTGIENGSQASPFNTIQEGVNAAGTGATVQVAAGVYVEQVSINNKQGLTLAGSGAGTVLTNALTKLLVSGGANVTVRDLTVRGGGQNGINVSSVSNFVLRNAVVENVTQAGYSYGGALYIAYSSASLVGNTIRNNYGGQKGGAAYLYDNVSLTVVSNSFINNYAWNSAGGLWIQDYFGASSNRISYNTFEGHHADYSGAIDLASSYSVTRADIDHNTFYNNGNSYGSAGGALKVMFDSPASMCRFLNNVVRDPYPVCCGAIKCGIAVASSSSVYVANNIFSSTVGGSAIHSFDAVNTNLVAEYNDAFGMTYYQVTAGAGSLSTNPLFVNAAAGDYHLQANSPCINAGHPAAQYNDADGSRNDMGIYGGLQNPPNQPPTANSQNVSTPEDTAKSITLTGSDPENATLSFSIVATPLNGSLSGSNSNWVYTPNANFNGSDSFKFRAYDGAAFSPTATVSITVTPVNDWPTAPSGSWTTMQDTAVNFTIGATDPDGDPLSCGVSDPPHGSVSGSFPNYTYTPDPGFVGSDYFSYTVTDPSTSYNYNILFMLVKPNFAGATIFIDASNTSGVENGSAASPYNTIQEGVNVSVPGSVIAVATGVYNEIVNLSGRTNVTLAGSGNLTYLNYSGYRVVISNAQDITIRNLRLDRGVMGAYVGRSTGIVLDKVIFDSFNSSGPITPLYAEYASIRVSGCTLSGGGGRYGDNGGAFYNCDVTYASNTVSSQSSWSGGSIANFYNDASNASRRIRVTGNLFSYSSGMQAISAGGYGAIDIDHNVLDSVGSRYNGMAGLFPRGGAQARVVNNTFNNEPETTFDQSKKHVFIDVTSTGSIQILNNIFADTSGAAVYCMSAVQPTVEYNDLFNMTNLNVIAGAGNISADPLFTTTYPQSFRLQPGSPCINAGNPSAAYNDADGSRNDMGAYGGNTNNAAPVAVSQSVSTPEDTPRAIGLGASDPNGDPLTFVIAQNPSFGTISGAGSNVVYTPNLNANGTDVFLFRAYDGQLYSGVATVTVVVAGVNDAPAAQDQSVSTPEDTAKAITLTATDPEGSALTYAVVQGPTNGTISGTAPNLTYNPFANRFGVDSFTFRASDGALTSNIARVTVTVTAVNDAPVAQNQSVVTTQGVAKAITLVATDVDNVSLSYSIVSNPPSGSLSGTPPNVTYTPGAAGTNRFTFRASDGSLFSNNGTVTVVVVAGVATASTVYVNVANNSGIENGTITYPYNTIQEGVNAALNGATISVAAGLYPESVMIYQRQNLSLVGAGVSTEITNYYEKIEMYYSGGITVDGFRLRGGNWAGVYATSCTNILVKNTTIEHIDRNPYGTGSGGAFEVYDSSVTAVSNKIQNITQLTQKGGGQYGGAGYFIRCALTFSANNVTNCYAWNQGGGIFVYNDGLPLPATISRNTFDLCWSDSSGAIDANGYFTLLQIENNVVSRSGATCHQSSGRGGAVRVAAWNTNSPVRVVNNVIADPQYPGCSGFIRVGLNVVYTSDVYAVNNIFSVLSGISGTAIHSYYPNAGVRAEYNDAYGMNYVQVTAGTGSVVAHPLYVSPSAGDYRLQATSPCINTGNPAAQYNDTNGTRNDMGRFGGPNGF